MKNNETEFANQDEEISKGMDYKAKWGALKDRIEDEIAFIRESAPKFFDETFDPQGFLWVKTMAGRAEFYAEILEIMEGLEKRK